MKESMKRSLGYAALGIVLALLTLVAGPALMGLPQATEDGDPDGFITKWLAILPLLAGVLAAYVIIVGLVEFNRRRGMHE